MSGNSQNFLLDKFGELPRFYPPFQPSIFLTRNGQNIETFSSRGGGRSFKHHTILISCCLNSLTAIAEIQVIRVTVIRTLMQKHLGCKKAWPSKVESFVDNNR